MVYQRYTALTSVEADRLPGLAQVRPGGAQTAECLALAAPVAEAPADGERRLEPLDPLSWGEAEVPP